VHTAYRIYLQGTQTDKILTVPRHASVQNNGPRLQSIHMSYTCTPLHGAPVRIKSILMQLSERQIFNAT